MGLDWASVFRVPASEVVFADVCLPASKSSGSRPIGQHCRRRQIGASDGGAELLASSGFAARLAGRSADRAAQRSGGMRHAAAVLGATALAGLDAGQAFAGRDLIP